MRSHFLCELSRYIRLLYYYYYYYMYVLRYFISHSSNIINVFLHGSDCWKMVARLVLLSAKSAVHSVLRRYVNSLHYYYY